MLQKGLNTAISGFSKVSLKNETLFAIPQQHSNFQIFQQKLFLNSFKVRSR